MKEHNPYDQPASTIKAKAGAAQPSRIPPISTEEFDDRLHRMVSDMSVSTLLSYGDVYATLAEELNNAILEEWEREQAARIAELDSIQEDGPQDGDLFTDEPNAVNGATVIWYRGRNRETFLFGTVNEARTKLAGQSANLWISGETPTLIPPQP